MSRAWHTGEIRVGIRPHREGVGMTRAQLFPTIMIALSIGASVAYAVDGDWRRTVYWFAAAVLNAAVTF